jgi:iron complex transport system ATP-binding protein
MNTTLLSCTNLQIGFVHRQAKKTVLASSIHFALTQGELVCLLGPNGSGKSTLLRTLTGLQAALDGTVFLQQKELSSLSRKKRAECLGITLTGSAQIEFMRVKDYVAMGRMPYTDWLDTLGEQDEAQVQGAMQLVDIEHLQNKWLSQVSDGERQRAAIARVLAQQAKVLCMDEPTSFLDLGHRIGLMRLLKKIVMQQQMGVLLSTHDLELALRFADRLFILDGQGGYECGATCDLIQQGSLSAIFAKDGIVFDEQGRWHVVE